MLNLILMNITTNQIHINLISKLVSKLSEARQCTTKMHMSAIISNVSVISLKLCLCFSLSLHLCVFVFLYFLYFVFAFHSISSLSRFSPTCSL